MPENPYQQTAPGSGIADAPVMDRRWTEIYASEVGVVLEFWKTRHGQPRLRQRHMGVDGFRAQSIRIERLRAVA